MKTDIRVCVCGGRDYDDRAFLFKVLDEVHAAHNIVCIIEGEQTGADTLAKEWAIARRVPFAGYPADWKQFGIYAGGYRNQQMLDDGKPDLVLAFPTGGPGTNKMVSQTRKAGVPFYVCT